MLEKDIFLFDFIGPILDDRLKEKLLKAWKGAHSSHFRVCLFLRTRATDHSFWARNQIFGLRDLWDMSKKTISFIPRITQPKN